MTKDSAQAHPPEQWGFSDLEARGPVIAMDAGLPSISAEVPRHQHLQGQLIMALKGALFCLTDNAVWVVPPNCAVWIPSNLPHSIRHGKNVSACYLFVAPGDYKLPETCCTVSLSPLVRELILYLSKEPSKYKLDSPTGRKAIVLLEELAKMPIEGLFLPTSSDPRIEKLTKQLTLDPSNRSTLSDWSRQLAMSDRAFTRLLLRETGLTFGRWRQQLHLLIAIQKLSSGLSVQHVAIDLGYDSVNAFITMFKKIMGKTPGRYFSDMGS